MRCVAGGVLRSASWSWWRSGRACASCGRASHRDVVPDVVWSMVEALRGRGVGAVGSGVGAVLRAKVFVRVGSWSLLLVGPGSWVRVPRAAGPAPVVGGGAREGEQGGQAAGGG